MKKSDLRSLGTCGRRSNRNAPSGLPMALAKLRAGIPARLLAGFAILIAALGLGVVMNMFEAPIGIALALAAGAAVLLYPLLWRDPELGIGLVGFLLPFERFPAVEVGGMAVRLNHLMIVVVLVSFILVKLFRRELKIPSDPLRWFIALFLISLTFSLPVAVNLSRSFQLLAFMALMGLVYFTTTLVVQSERALKIALKGIIWGALIVGILALYQFFGDMIGLPNSVTLLKEGYDKSTFGFARVQAASIEPLYFANYLFLPLSILAVALVRGQAEKIIGRRMAYLLTAILAIDFILTVSRGAYIAALAVLLAFIVLQAKLILRLKTIITVVMAAIFILGGAYLALLKSEPRALDEFIAHVQVQDREEGESVVSRVNASKQALELWAEKPVFGIGIGNFGPRVQNDPDEKPEEAGWFIVNDEYLELLAENGLVSLGLFALILAVAFYRGTKVFFMSHSPFLRAMELALMLALLGEAVQYATFSTLYIFHFWFLIGLVSATTNLISLPPPHQRRGYGGMNSQKSDTPRLTKENS